MKIDLFNIVNASIERMGLTELDWISQKRPPKFQVIKKGWKGPRILLLHGLFGAVSNWDNVMPYMSKYARLLALHFPILTGQRSDVKVKALTAFTEYYIRSKKLGPTIICGNSLGGHVALRLALTAPELVSKLILSGSSGLYEHTVDSLPVHPDERFVREHMDRVFYNKHHITEEAIAQVAQILSDRSRQLNLIHAARSAKRDNLAEVLPLIKAPTLLLWGTNDKITTMEVANTFKNLIPNSKLETIDNCGHAPMIEHPEWFSEKIKEFIR